MTAAAVPKWDLEYFRLKSMDLGQLTGVSMAVHAVPDAFLLKHTGVGCKHKTVTQFGTHEWGRGLAAHEGWTEVGDASLIRGSADRLGPYARSSWQRHRPAVIVMVSVTFLDLTGDDYANVARDLDEELPCHVVWVRCPGYEGDLWSGYLTATLDLAKRVDWKVEVDRPNDVAFFGYLWDRYEGDHQGNQLQLKALLAGLGLGLGPVWLSGQGFEELSQSPRCGVQVLLPYAAPKAKTVRRLVGRDLVPVQLPIGFRATAAFLRAIGAAAGVEAARVDAVVRKQEAQTRERLGSMLAPLQGRRVAIFADLPLAVGMVALLEELGLVVEAVGIRGHSLGGRAALEAGLTAIGAALPVGCLVIENPSLAKVREVVSTLAQAGRLDGVLGSATDHNAISTLPAGLFMASQAGDQIVGGGPFRLEIGFPCKEHHCTYAMPFLGYMGMLIWVQRLMSAPRLWDGGRSLRL